MREQYDKLMNEAELAFDKPIAVYESSVDDYLQNLSEADRVKFSLLDQIFPAIRSVRVAMETRMARRDATELALAVLRFHAQRGDWPVSIGELAPDFLDSIPTDPLNAEPLKWKVTNENTLNVYSVGNNGTDDHGRPMMDKKTGETVPASQFQFREIRKPCPTMAIGFFGRELINCVSNARPDFEREYGGLLAFEFARQPKVNVSRPVSPAIG
jgi:hypothetical protein